MSSNNNYDRNSHNNNCAHTSHHYNNRSLLFGRLKNKRFNNEDLAIIILQTDLQTVHIYQRNYLVNESYSSECSYLPNLVRNLLKILI